VRVVHYEMPCWPDGSCGVCSVRGPLLAGWVHCLGFWSLPGLWFRGFEVEVVAVFLVCLVAVWFVWEGA
ncbi:hypothetical protein Ancab_030506, partial [Ancistrocladus abbreviatus]